MATKPRTRDEATSASPFFVAKPITLPVPLPMPGIRQFIVDPHKLAMERELRAAQLERERTTSYQFAIVPPESVADCPLGALLSLLVRDRDRVLEIGSRGCDGLVDRPIDPAFLWLACDRLHDAWWSLAAVYKTEVPDIAEFADNRLGGQDVREKLATIKPREVVAALTRLVDFVATKVAVNSVEVAVSNASAWTPMKTKDLCKLIGVEDARTLRKRIEKGLVRARSADNNKGKLYLVDPAEIARHHGR